LENSVGYHPAKCGSAWVTNEHGLIEGHEPDNYLAYDLSDDFHECFVWTPEQYRDLIETLGPFELVQSYNRAGELMSLFHQPLQHILIVMKQTHNEIIKFLGHRLSKATRYGYCHAKCVFVLMYQMDLKYVPLFLHSKEFRDEKDNAEINRIAEWRLKQEGSLGSV
jgi:hypothetical protein